MTQNDSEYKLFLIVNHVKHSKLYNEPIVYQIKSAGGILIKKNKKNKNKNKTRVCSSTKPSTSDLKQAEIIAGSLHTAERVTFTLLINFVLHFHHIKS